MKILIPYDGSLTSRDTLKMGIAKAAERCAEVVVLHLFNVGMFMDYNAGPAAIERARAEAAAHVEDAKRIIKEHSNGVRTSIFTGDGDPDEAIMEFAETNRIDVILCPATLKSAMNRYRNVLKKQGKESKEICVFDETERLRSGTAKVFYS
jgi:nucleotide-binding universal stress UspA family protein